MASLQSSLLISDMAMGLAAEHVKGLSGSLVGVGREFPSWQQLHPTEGETRVHLGCDEWLDEGPLETRMRAPFTLGRIEKIVGHWILLGHLLKHEDHEETNGTNLARNAGQCSSNSPIRVTCATIVVFVIRKPCV
jgi:hypothetical protein